MSAPWANGGCVQVGVSSTSHLSKKALQSRHDAVPFGEEQRPGRDVDRRVLHGGEVEEGLESGAHHVLEQRPHEPDVGKQHLHPQLDGPLVRRWHGLVDVVAGIGQRIGRTTDRAADAGVGRPSGRLGAHRDAEPCAGGAPVRG